MKTNPIRNEPRPLLILGRVPNAADLALRRILHAKVRKQSLIVVDGQGHLANQLTERNRGNLHKSPTHWFDLANRRRPVALFRFKASSGMQLALHYFLDRCIAAFGLSISDATKSAAVDLALRMADSGSIGLASLLAALRRPETSYPVRRAAPDTKEIDRLRELLDWLLHFPGVWALSEGNNVVDLPRALREGGTAWIELPAAHFERIEHRIVHWMVDAVLIALLSPAIAEKGGLPASDPPPLMIHGFPCDAAPLLGPAGRVKQIAIYPFADAYPLPAAATAWVEAGADCWFAGEIGRLPEARLPPWLTPQERERLCQLEAGQVLVRTASGPVAATVRVRPPEGTVALARTYRRHSLKRLRLSPVKQFASALPNELVSAPQNTDIYRQLCTRDALWVGWFRVKAHNRFSHGADRVTIERFGANLEAELNQLARELSEGRYRCRPLHLVRVPKPDGDERVLKVACVRDRVTQAACLHLIEPIFEARFSNASFAYRPGRGAHHAVSYVRALVRDERPWVVTADIRKCFDTIDHDILLRLVGDAIGDRDLLQLLRHWLTVDVIDFMDIIPGELGVPQGESISPLLANIYLDTLDKHFEESGVRFARYADDYAVLCKTETEAQAALAQMNEFLQHTLRLSLKPAKTQYGRVASGFDFLGFSIRDNDVLIPAERVSRTLVKTLGLIEQIASPATSAMDKCQGILTLNAQIRGFRNYFLIDDAPGVRRQLLAMDQRIEQEVGQSFGGSDSLESAWVRRECLLPPDKASMPATTDLAAGMPGSYAIDQIVQDGSRLPAPTPLSPSAPSSLTTASATIPQMPLFTTPANAADPDPPDDPDVLLLDGRLHVMTSGCYVTVSRDELLVRQRKNELFRVALVDVSMVYLEGKGIAVSADLTMRLCELDVPVVFTPLIGIPAAIAQPVRSLRGHVRQQQVLRRNDPEMLKTGTAMLAAKDALIYSQTDRSE